MSAFAVIPTRPARKPFNAIERSGFLRKIHEIAIEARAPPQAASAVVVKTSPIPEVSAERTTAVETEPTQEEEEDTNGGEWHAVTQNGLDAVFRIFTCARSKDHHTCKCRVATKGVHHGRTGKVFKSVTIIEAAEPTSTPVPGTTNWYASATAR